MAARSRMRFACGVTAAAGVLTLAGCASSGPAAPPDASAPAPVVTTAAAPGPAEGLDVVFAMDFDGSDPLSSTPSGDAVVTEESFFGGELTVVPSFSGSGDAIQFPAFAAQEDEPGVGLVAKAGGSPLPSPGSSSFGFGADVRFDDLSAESDADNGDNILQRGLAADPSQYKLQVDHGKPSCTVTGSAGRLLVKGERLEDGTWYRLACLLDEGELTLVVTDLSADTSADFVEAGTVGTVEFADDIPIAIGRKVGPGGAGINKQPDQFNGTMDSLWIGIGATP